MYIYVHKIWQALSEAHRSSQESWTLSYPLARDGRWTLFQFCCQCCNLMQFMDLHIFYDRLTQSWTSWQDLSNLVETYRNIDTSLVGNTVPENVSNESDLSPELIAQLHMLAHDIGVQEVMSVHLVHRSSLGLVKHNYTWNTKLSTKIIKIPCISICCGMYGAYTHLHRVKFSLEIYNTTSPRLKYRPF